MPAGSEALRVYESLADWYERQSQAQMRDRFLLLAADTALADGQPDEAERLRLRLLQHSPHHMLRPFASFAEALRSPDVQGYLSDLRQTYPPETAEQLLASLRAEGGDAEPIPSLAPQPPPREQRPLPSAPPKREAPPPPPAEPTRVVEPLKVYRIKDDEKEPVVANGPPARPAPTRKPPAPPAAQPPPRPTAAPRMPASLPPLASLPPPAAPPPRPPLPRREEPVVYRTQPVVAPPPPEVGLEPPTEPAEKTGGWVAVGLFTVVLIAGVALTVYTFARPFLPPQMLP